jgi:hypothetical protein
MVIVIIRRLRLRGWNKGRKVYVQGRVVILFGQGLRLFL